MKSFVKNLLSIALFLNCISAFAQEYDWTPANIDVAENYIVPRYKVLALITDRMLDDITKLCADIENEVVINDHTKHAFRDLFLAWADVQHIQFGPMSFLKRFERFHYWPDKHNVGARQLQRLLTDIESGMVRASDLVLAKKSVSVQGLSALERLLFAPSQTLNVSGCILSLQIAANLKDIAEQSDSSWRLAPVEFAKEFQLAGREQGTYGSSLDVATMLGNTLATQFLLIAEYKLGRALPKEQGGRVYQRQLEAWLSKSSLAIIERSVLSLRELYLMAFGTRTKELDEELYTKILDQFALVEQQIDKFEQPLIQAIVDEQKLSDIVALQTEIMSLEAVLRSELFATLGFATRFNSLDGD